MLNLLVRIVPHVTQLWSAQLFLGTALVSRDGGIPTSARYMSHVWSTYVNIIQAGDTGTKRNVLCRIISQVQRLSRGLWLSASGTKTDFGARAAAFRHVALDSLVHLMVLTAEVGRAWAMVGLEAAWSYRELLFVIKLVAIMITTMLGILHRIQRRSCCLGVDCQDVASMWHWVTHGRNTRNSRWLTQGALRVARELDSALLRFMDRRQSNILEEGLAARMRSHLLLMLLHLLEDLLA